MEILPERLFKFLQPILGFFKAEAVKEKCQKGDVVLSI
jgi:hypothetical protein